MNDTEHTLRVDEGRLQGREQSYRMTVARLLDAVRRYPSDLDAACAAASLEMRRVPLWSELAEEEDARLPRWLKDCLRERNS